jgi:cytochrome P450
MSAPPAADYDLLAPGTLADPYPLYRALREQGRVHWSASLGGWGLTRHDDVRPALNATDLSARRFAPYLERLAARPDADPEDVRLYESLNRWFTFDDPPGHTRLRTHTRRVFSAPMKAMTGAVETMVDELLDGIERNGGGDVIADFARPMSVGAIADLLGVPRADCDRFTQWSDLLTEVIGGALAVDDRRRRAARGVRELDDYLGALVRRRRAEPTPDLIGRLAAIGGEDAPADEEIAAIGAMMLFAGHGTTTNLIGNGLLALLRHPRQLELLRREPERVPDAVEELLRFDSPVQVTVRYASRDGALGVEEIAAGDRVFLFVASANRDAPGVDAPEELDVARADGKHLTFGYGIHFCIGAPLARIEAPIAFTRLIERFPRLRLAVPEHELAWQRTVGFRGLVSLPVRVD